MEVNTRIQVENGVSAAISRVKGKEVDLIAEQIRTGLGDPLGYTQDDITFHGVGVEYRIIAEDPDNGFSPWVATSTASAGKSTNGAAFTRMCLRPRPSIPTPFPPSSIPTWRWPSSGARILPR